VESCTVSSGATRLIDKVESSKVVRDGREFVECHISTIFALE